MKYVSKLAQMLLLAGICITVCLFIAVNVIGMQYDQIEQPVKRINHDIWELSRHVARQIEQTGKPPAAVPMPDAPEARAELGRAHGEKMTTMDLGTMPRSETGRYYVEPFLNPEMPIAYVTDGVRWVLASPGPDRVFDFDPKRIADFVPNGVPDSPAAGDYRTSITYDPTNGLISSGDILEGGRVPR